jgi:D-sedoheptulose 7-phosphate isomerase
LEDLPTHSYINKRIEASIQLKNRCITDQELIKNLEHVMAACVKCYQNKCKIFFCGNGGSAADAQHLASELSGRFYIDRRPLFAEALHVNTSHLTAVANDYSFDEVYSRLIEAKGVNGDILFAISTSGKSPNILKAVKKAQELGILTIGMTGAKSNLLADTADISIAVPSQDTPRIQEVHILLGHIICEYVENELFGNNV